MLLDYEDGLELEEDNLRHDRIEILIDGIWFEGDIAEYHVFLDELVSSPDDVEDFAINCNNVGWIFRRPEGRNSIDPRYLLVRESNEISPLPIPLFGGKLDLAGFDRDEGNFTKQLKFTLQFNPTRLFAFQNLERSTSTNREHQMVEPLNLGHSSRLRIDGYTYRTRNPEFSLDGSNNFILGDHWLNLCTNEFWESFLYSSLNSVVEAYLTQVRRAFRVAKRNSPVRIDRDGARFTLKRVETYCEVIPSRGLNPVEFVRRIMPSLERYAQSIETEYPVNPRYEENSLSPSIALNVGARKEVVVYSKTNRRVRFEYRQSGDAINGTRTTNTIEGLIDRILRQKSVASRQLNLVMGWLNDEVIWENSIPRTPHYFISQIYRFSQSPAIAELIVSSLIWSGSINPIRINGMSSSISRLLSQGVLRSSRNPGRAANQSYTVSRTYSESLDMLRTFLRDRDESS